MRAFLRATPARLALLPFSLFLLVSLLSRVALLITARHDAGWDLSLIGAFAIGCGFDAASAVFAALPWLLLGALLPASWANSRAGRLALACSMALFLALLIFISAAEWFFWDEFGARFNFIAVDYLVWTQEVLTNIAQSYPIVPICGAIAAVAAGMAWLMHRTGCIAWAVAAKTNWQSRCGWPLAGMATAALTVLMVDQSALPVFGNQYNAELAKNGCWSFLAAARHMELDYGRWYPSLPQAQALHQVKHLLNRTDEPEASSADDNLARDIRARGPEHRWNVITICMESMSGAYMSYLGNNSGITPELDRLANNSVFFNNLYATGTRTVRGIEAITLNLPPTPGQAILYRPEGTHLVTTFTPFTERGYDCAFFYGGDGRFDFMNRYFSTAGCRIMDAPAWQSNDITMKTAWGACDEDLFRKTLAQADADHAAGKPFHFFCMTTSNHRPYDFPADRIDLAPHHRKSAVKYADWAVGNLIEQARQRPWFHDTLFVIVADHCASSAGKAELNINKYRIPAMIYNPELVAPQAVPVLCSQIDVMPTVFGLLNWNHQTLGYGHDLLSPSNRDQPGRAFVSNYQKVALLRNNELTILKPNQQVSSYACDPTTGELSLLAPDVSADMVRDTTAFYQTACWLFNSGKLKQPPPPHMVALR